jgi:hypothetical protein
VRATGDTLASTLDSIELDHVLIAVADLAVAGREIEAWHGLASIEGGHHPAWGTANRIVPLGDTYLELIAVIDASKAAKTEVGRWVASGASTTGSPLGWVVRTSQLEEIAGRLNLPIHIGSRTTPAGDVLRWRTAGTDQAAAEPSLPFFIEWDPETPFPGRTAIRHRVGNPRIARVVLDTDVHRLARWLGEHHLPIDVHPGKPAVIEIHITTDAGEVVLGPRN